MTLEEAIENLKVQQALAAAVARFGNDAGANIWREKAEAIRIVLAALERGEFPSQEKRAA